MNVLEVIETISAILNVIGKIKVEMGHELKEIMEIYESDFEKICTLIKKFSSSNEEATLIERLKFYLNNGFREFRALYDLNPESFYDILY